MGDKIIKRSKDAMEEVIAEVKGLMAEGGVIKREVHQAAARAREILMRAQQEAQRIIAEAQRESELMRRKGYDEGYEAGLAKLNEILVQFKERQDDVLRRAEPELVNLSVRIAEKIIGRELKLSSDAIADIVAQALRNLRRQREITIKVNPEDLAKLKEHKASLLELVGEAKINFMPDEHVSSGGCIIESELGTVDAQLETQLRTLEQTLLKRVKKI